MSSKTMIAGYKEWLESDLRTYVLQHGLPFASVREAAAKKAAYKAKRQNQPLKYIPSGVQKSDEELRFDVVQDLDHLICILDSNLDPRVQGKICLFRAAHVVRMLYMFQGKREEANKSLRKAAAIAKKMNPSAPKAATVDFWTTAGVAYGWYLNPDEVPQRDKILEKAEKKLDSFRLRDADTLLTLLRNSGLIIQDEDSKINGVSHYSRINSRRLGFAHLVTSELVSAGIHSGLAHRMSVSFFGFYYTGFVTGYFKLSLAKITRICGLEGIKADARTVVKSFVKSGVFKYKKDGSLVFSEKFTEKARAFTEVERLKTTALIEAGNEYADKLVLKESDPEAYSEKYDDEELDDAIAPVTIYPPMPRLATVLTLPEDAVVEPFNPFAPKPVVPASLRAEQTKGMTDFQREVFIKVMGSAPLPGAVEWYNQKPKNEFHWYPADSDSKIAARIFIARGEDYFEAFPNSPARGFQAA